MTKLVASLCGYDNRRMIDVEAEIVDVAPHVAWTFVVHRTPYFRGRWNVTNLETGRRIGNLCTKRLEAINAAQAILAERTAEVIDCAVTETYRTQFAGGWE